uniref:Large ribosomal subunit protein uL14 n=1 Tax=Equus caballus TaxID=9796 RepID=A0A9L0TDI5_HORSE
IGSSGTKFRSSLGLPGAAITNCADNTGAKTMYIISVKWTKGQPNRLPASDVGDMVMATVKKGKPELREAKRGGLATDISSGPTFLTHTHNLYIYLPPTKKSNKDIQS